MKSWSPNSIKSQALLVAVLKKEQVDSLYSVPHRKQIIVMLNQIEFLVWFGKNEQKDFT